MGQFAVQFHYTPREYASLTFGERNAIIKAANDAAK